MAYGAQKKNKSLNLSHNQGEDADTYSNNPSILWKNLNNTSIPHGGPAGQGYLDEECMEDLHYFFVAFF